MTSETTPQLVMEIIASSDELTIESNLISLEGTEWEQTLSNAYKEALSLIDGWVRDGIYEKQRARVQAKFPQSLDATRRLADAYRAADKGYLSDLSNALAGVRSPDEEQRKRFKALLNRPEYASVHPHDLRHIFAVLERAKRPSGRPSISPPWRNVNDELHRMMRLIDAGASPSEAAREVVGDRAGADNRANRLVRLLRQKLALRE